MGKGEACSPGTEIISESTCEDALQYAPLLGITLNNRYTLIKGSRSNIPGYPHIVPYQCSYQSYEATSKYGDQAFHFNGQETSDATGFLNGWYKMICRTGQILLLHFKNDKSKKYMKRCHKNNLLNKGLIIQI